jgi:flavoprotein
MHKIPRCGRMCVVYPIKIQATCKGFEARAPKCVVCTKTHSTCVYLPTAPGDQKRCARCVASGRPCETYEPRSLLRPHKASRQRERKRIASLGQLASSQRVKITKNPAEVLKQASEALAQSPEPLTSNQIFMHARPEDAQPY